MDMPLKLPSIYLRDLIHLPSSVIFLHPVYFTWPTWSLCPESENFYG